MDKKEKRSFIFYFDWAEILTDYPAEVRLEVYDAIIRYAASGTLSELKPQAKMAFSFIKKQLDQDHDKWDGTIEKRRAAANARYAKTDPPDGDGNKGGSDCKSMHVHANDCKSCKSMHVHANAGDNDCVNDNDNVNKKKREKDKSFSKESAKKPPGVFRPPTVEEVRDYVQQKGYPVDAEMFVDFYASKGWMVGKNRMKDWQAAVRTWKRKREEDPYNYEPITVAKNGNATNPNFSRQGTRGNIFTGEQLDAIIEASQKLDELDNGR